MIQKIKAHKIKLLVVAALVAVVLSVVAWANSDNIGVVEIPNKPLAQVNVASSKVYSSPYISFRYSGIYKLRKVSITPNSETLEQLMLKAGTTYEKHTAVAVEDLPAGSLANNSANNLRLNSPDIYTARNAVVDGGQAVIWQKKDGTEQTVFIPHGNHVATISFVQVGALDDLTPEVNSLLATFKWKM